MSIEQEFFKKLQNKAGDHPLKNRLEEELKEHVEDSALYKKESLDQSMTRLGKPKKIARELKDIYFSFQRFAIYVAVYFTIVLPLSVLASIILLHQVDILLFITGFSPIFIIVVSPLVGFIFAYSEKRFGYTQKEIVLYGMGVEIIKAFIVAFLMMFTHKLYFMFDPDVRPYIPHMFFIEMCMAAFGSWVGGSAGKFFNRKNPPVVGV
jgi:hypothetical protein